jgi:hypothetical protein
MNTWGKGHPDPTSSTPRSMAPLVASLDRLAINRVFANYWIAYQLDFASRERIVAVENGFNRLVVHDSDLLPTPDPRVRYPPYQREVRAGPHGFVFFRDDLPAAPILGELHRFGYTRHLVERFVIYAPPARAVNGASPGARAHRLRAVGYESPARGLGGNHLTDELRPNRLNV